MATIIREYFYLRDEHEDALRSNKPEFGYDGFGEAVYYRTYSRRKPANMVQAALPEVNEGTGLLNWSGQEKWADTVIRNINGVFTIRKDWYIKNGIHWDEKFWQTYALNFGRYMFNMYWLPPGRGLWAMGTRFIYERGSMALNNCGFTELGSNGQLSLDYEWMADALMCGVGVGFHALRDDLKVYAPKGSYIFDILDCRESWAQSVRLLVDAYTILGARKPVFTYNLIRAEGLPIRGFGGLASGPAPLMKLHKQIELCFNRYLNDSSYDLVQLKTDIANMIGCCVVAGNVRRSAELGLGGIRDQVFLNLKDYDLYPERAEFGWMSNNTAGCEQDEDFDMLGEVAKRVPLKGEPGIANWRNFPKGRIGKKNKGLRPDKARGLNPCGEIPLENKELCNVSETAPTRCPDIQTWLQACEFSAFYASTVSLLPTHWACTNAVVGRNRRIGVGIIDYTGWIKRDGLFKVTKALRQGYKIVSETNRWANGQAGVPEAIRKTTIKPGGTVPKLVGRTSGAGYPTFEYMLRRIRVAANSPVVPIFRAANVPCEPDVTDPTGTLIFAFPVASVGAKPAERASIWEQANNLVTLQREWADNAVSNTIYFQPKWVLTLSAYNRESFEKLMDDQNYPDVHYCDIIEALDAGHNKEVPNGWKIEFPKHGGIRLYGYNPNHEEDDIEPVLSSILPVIKACSLLPHSPQGVYKQMPEEGITQAEYLHLKEGIQPIDWTTFSGSDGEDDKFCQGDRCAVPA